MKTGDCLIQSWRMRVAARWIPRGGRVLDNGSYQSEFLFGLGEKIALDPTFSMRLVIPGAVLRRRVSNPVAAFFLGILNTQLK